MSKIQRMREDCEPVMRKIYNIMTEQDLNGVIMFVDKNGDFGYMSCGMDINQIAGFVEYVKFDIMSEFKYGQ